MVSGFTLQAISKWAKARLLPGTILSSDGLGCFAAVTEAACRHAPKIVGILKPCDLPEFKWINTVLGNLKTTSAGAFHALKYRKYAQAHLLASAYRFNRRFDLRDLGVRLIVDVARTPPMPQSTIRLGHAQAAF